jgi:hypothetical protein
MGGLFIMIIILPFSYGPTVEVVPFRTMEACEVAREALIEDIEYRKTIKCVARN